MTIRNTDTRQKKRPNGQKMLKALEKEKYDDTAWKITVLTVILETD